MVKLKEWHWLALAVGAYVVYTQRDKISSALNTLSNPQQAAASAASGAATGAINGAIDSFASSIQRLLDNASVAAYNARNEAGNAANAAVQNAQLAINRTSSGVVLDPSSGLYVLPQYVGTMYRTSDGGWRSHLQDTPTVNSVASSVLSSQPANLITTAAGSRVVDVPLYATPSQATAAMNAIQNLQSVGGGSPPVRGISGLG